MFSWCAKYQKSETYGWEESTRKSQTLEQYLIFRYWSIICSLSRFLGFSNCCTPNRVQRLSRALPRLYPNHPWTIVFHDDNTKWLWGYRVKWQLASNSDEFPGHQIMLQDRSQLRVKKTNPLCRHLQIYKDSVQLPHLRWLSLVLSENLIVWLQEAQRTFASQLNFKLLSWFRGFGLKGHTRRENESSEFILRSCFFHLSRVALSFVLRYHLLQRCHRI